MIPLFLYPSHHYNHQNEHSKQPKIEKNRHHIPTYYTSVIHKCSLPHEFITMKYVNHWFTLNSA